MFWNYNFSSFLLTSLVCAIYYGITHSVRNELVPSYLVLVAFAACVLMIMFVVSIVLYLIFKDTTEGVFRMLHTFSVLVVMGAALVLYCDLA